ncbi:MAG: shikimate kinase [Candidatus Paceibacterota bacterium]|jgi:shikimate kinase
MKGITLIGMPGAGKSTIGKLLAKHLRFKFLDLDILINQKEGIDIDEILQNKGDEEILRLETDYTLQQNLSDTVFSPGGSIIYSPQAMEKIKQETTVIYLETPLKEIRKRLNGKIKRQNTIVGLREKGIDKLYEERIPLYKSYADSTVNCCQSNRCLNSKIIVANILQTIGQKR